MQRFEYKGHAIEIFTTKTVHGWTWALTIDGIVPASNRDPSCCESLDLAVAVAKRVAHALIDEGC